MIGFSETSQPRAVPKSTKNGHISIFVTGWVGGGLFLPLGGEKIPGEVVTRKDLSHFLLRSLLIYNDIERVAFMKTFPTGGVQFASPGWLTFTFHQNST